MKKIVISTGAGMSAESGLSTFRDADGLWDNYDVMEVASADGFARNPALVHEFYNIRRTTSSGISLGSIMFSGDSPETDCIITLWNLIISLRTTIKYI